MLKDAEKGGSGELPLAVRQDVFGTKDGHFESRFIHYEMMVILIGGMFVFIHMSLLILIIVISAFFVCYMLYTEMRGRQLQAQ